MMDKKVFILNSIQKVNYMMERLRLINPKNDNQPTYMVTVGEYRSNRSTAQNRLLWLWLKLIVDHIKDTTGQIFSDEDMNEWFKEKFLETKIIEFRGEVLKARKSSKKLNTKEFTHYLENIDMYCAENLGLVLPHPDDLYYSAMGER